MRHGPKASHDPGRQLTLKHRPHRRAKARVVVNVAAGQCDIRHRPGDRDDLGIEALFAQETALLRRAKA